MNDPQPQYAPGDPVLVAGEFVSLAPNPDVVWIDIAGDTPRGTSLLGTIYPVRVSDVHPVPPTPDPRDTALAAVRKLHARDFDRECEECRDVDGAWVPWPCDTIRALDGVTPVPAPPAPTPTGRSLAQVEAAADAIAAMLPDLPHDFIRVVAGHALRRADGAPSALRAEEAAAGAAASTQSAAASVAGNLAWTAANISAASIFSYAEVHDSLMRLSGYVPAAEARAILPRTSQSDLVGLGAREAGLAAYPATDARSEHQDVSG